ncbi:MAG: methyl-accepting chemotaxis protein [Gammaproteobacteria bacterium]|nr:methyl-accepting chemotaxis protein [Gammaproteobacteria bacterium]MBU1481132.1 methyl-accepting chemotaxis protein [Gammaproteobacteria bacterium]
MKNLKLSQKFAVLVLASLAGFVVASIASFWALSELKVNGPLYQRIVQGKDLVADILPPPEYIIETYLVALELKDVDSPGQRDKGIARLEALRKDYDDRHAFWLKQSLEPNQKQALLTDAHGFAQEFYKKLDEQYLPALRSGDKDRIRGVMSELQSVYENHRQAIDRVVAMTNDRNAADEARGRTLINQVNLLLLLVTVLSTSLSIGLAIYISRSVLHQLGGDPNEVAAAVNTMAAGDFSQQPPRQPEPGSLLAHAYQMQGKLRDMIMEVKKQANQVGDMAHSLASSANQISGNVNLESDAVSSMAAAIEELSVSTSHISDQGANAKRIATDSRGNAEEGAKVVNKTVAGLLETAREIEAASGEVSRLGEDATHISDVVKVIKEIADQTNLLALNAAIEAARAGEQGRGFAVVADEVRKLAERTASATSEINQMSSKIGNVANNALSGMDKVVKTTRQGVVDAETAQTSIRNIQSSFAEVSAVIDDIASALLEQNAAAAELANSTERVSQMSEEDSGAAKGLLGLANELEGKAGEMRQAVEIFRV